jgi:hypothetical protein
LFYSSVGFDEFGLIFLLYFFAILLYFRFPGRIELLNFMLEILDCCSVALRMLFESKGEAVNPVSEHEPLLLADQELSIGL